MTEIRNSCQTKRKSRVDLFVNRDRDRRNLARTVYEQIRDGIAAGRLRPGDRLPPSRELAVDLGVSRFTITTAYGYLVAEGFLEGGGAAGTYVAADAGLATRRSRGAGGSPPDGRGARAPAGTGASRVSRSR